MCLIETEENLIQDEEWRGVFNSKLFFARNSKPYRQYPKDR